MIRVDLDPDEKSGANGLSALLLGGDAEEQIAIRGGERFVARLTRIAQPAEDGADDSAPVRLDIAERGVLDNLVLVPCARRAPGPGEVEIRVLATGLNFRDVLNALGMYPGPPPLLGGECAGTIAAVGEGVTDLLPGDPVVGIAHGSFATYAVTRREFVVRKPAALEFEEAAALPAALLTAAFALHELGRIRPGERVLIHAAAGGVGLAAVHLARRAGAEVIATAGSPEKRARLRSLGIAHVFDSRSTDFAQAIRVMADGRGVDLVLNSLTGDCIPASLSVLSHGGRFLELGKLGAWEPARIAACRPDVEYHLVDVAASCEADPAIVARLLPPLVAAAAEGRIGPLPLTTFELARAADAFRWMAQAKHIGKVVLTQPRPVTGLRRDATYLVTGGLGGLGLALAKWFVEHGAGHVVLMGRHAPDARALAQLHAIEALGGSVTTALGDVANPGDVHAVLDGIAGGQAPLRGIVHAAGVLDDGVLLQQSWQRFERVLRPKVAGAWNLDVATRVLPLDFFVLFSSAASLLGLPGQGNHAAANAFLDALAFSRRNAGLPALTINWGPWRDIGAAAAAPVLDRIRVQGMRPIPPSEGLSLFGRLLRSGSVQAAVLPVDWNVFTEQVTRGVPPFFSLLVERTGAPDAAAPAACRAVDANPLLARLRAAGDGRKRSVLVEHLREQVRRALGFESGHPIDDRQPLSELGLDSLMAVELRNALGVSLGLARPLPATLMFDFPTIEALADFLGARVLGFAPAASARPDRPGAALVDEIAALTELEAERLLIAELERGAKDFRPDRSR